MNSGKYIMKSAEYEQHTMNAPVVLFVYNRVIHTKQTLEALMKNRNASNTCIYIYSDAAKDKTEQNNVAFVREYLEQVAKLHPFKNLEIIKQTENQGLEKSIIDGVTKVINQYGRVIVLEDDIITTPDFLDFMNGALDAFEKDGNVWSISSSTISNRRILRCKEDVLWTYRGECWGWASWKDRWNKVDWEVKEYPRFLKDKKMQHRFNRGGADMTSLLKMQQNGEIHSWAIRWCFEQFLEDKITVFSKYPKSYNIGLDGSGTNCGMETKRRVEIKEEDNWMFEYSLKNRKLIYLNQHKHYISYLRQHMGKYWYNMLEHVGGKK